MKFTTRSLAIPAMCIATATQAAVIDIEIGSKSELALIESAFLSNLTITAEENFDSMGGDASYTGHQQEKWENHASSFRTDVGVFTLEKAGQAGSNLFNDHLMIESKKTGEYGRQSLAGSGEDFWLDSNDAKLVSWDLADVDANAIGFYMADVNDQNARLNLTFKDGSSEQFDMKYDSASLSYVTITGIKDIASAVLSFENCKTLECTSYHAADGWGIDDIVVGVFEVTEPTSIVLFGLGAFGIAASRRRIKQKS